MDAKNVRIMCNLTGGYSKLLEQTIKHWQVPHPDRFIVFTEPWYAKIKLPDYSRFQAEQLENAKKAGARGLKVLKTLGLYLRENVTTGPLLKVDDKRFDAMWETAGSLNMPVAIHVSDPEAFFLPTDRFNERYEAECPPGLVISRKRLSEQCGTSRSPQSCDGASPTN